VSKLARQAGYVGIGLKPPTEPGRHTAKLRGAWCLKPYWGKPNVRNFREDGWKRDHGSRTEAQSESVGIATGPYRARASVLPDSETPDHGTVTEKHDECLEIRETCPRNRNG
jgi:hypothetical protein